MPSDGNVSPCRPRVCVGYDALTVCLYPDVHLGLGGVGDGVGAELNIRATAPHVSMSTLDPTSQDSNVLLHNNPSQRIPKGVALLKELERGGGISRAGKLIIRSVSRPPAKNASENRGSTHNPDTRGDLLLVLLLGALHLDVLHHRVVYRAGHYGGMSGSASRRGALVYLPKFYGVAGVPARRRLRGLRASSSRDMIDGIRRERSMLEMLEFYDKPYRPKNVVGCFPQLLAVAKAWPQDRGRRAKVSSSYRTTQSDSLVLCTSRGTKNNHKYIETICTTLPGPR